MPRLGGAVHLDWPDPVSVLLLPQSVVERTALGQQLVVGASLADGAVFEHQDLVGVGHRGQAVRDADGGASFRCRLQRLQDRLQFGQVRSSRPHLAATDRRSLYLRVPLRSPGWRWPRRRR